MTGTLESKQPHTAGGVDLGLSVDSPRSTTLEEKIKDEIKQLRKDAAFYAKDTGNKAWLTEFDTEIECIENVQRLNRLAVDELRKKIKENSHEGSFDDLISIYKIREIIDEVLGFTAEGADKK